jgi:hypothetical protein
LGVPGGGADRCVCVCFVGGGWGGRVCVGGTVVASVFVCVCLWFLLLMYDCGSYSAFVCLRLSVCVCARLCVCVCVGNSHIFCS